MERGWKAHVLGEAPETFKDALEAVTTLRVCFLKPPAHVCHTIIALKKGGGEQDLSMCPPTPLCVTVLQCILAAPRWNKSQLNKLAHSVQPQEPASQRRRLLGVATGKQQPPVVSAKSASSPSRCCRATRRTL